MDVGIWKSFFDRSVRDSIDRIVNEVQIQINLKEL